MAGCGTVGGLGHALRSLSTVAGEWAGGGVRDCRWVGPRTAVVVFVELLEQVDHPEAVRGQELGEA